MHILAKKSSLGGNSFEDFCKNKMGKKSVQLGYTIVRFPLALVQVDTKKHFYESL